jgi:hypothetical protein
LLLHGIQLDHFIEELELSMGFVVLNILESLLFFPEESIIKLTYMNVLVNFKLGVCYLKRRVVNFENLLIPLGYFLVMLSNFEVTDLEISIGLI